MTDLAPSDFMLSKALGDLQRVTDLTRRYRETRDMTEWLCEPLLIEDYGIQSMQDVSPPKWHLAHTTWFFETFILQKHAPGYKLYQPVFAQLFNSYYKSQGPHWERSKRGLLSRPSVQEVYRYRAAIDQQIQALIDQATEQQLAQIEPLLILGIQHEQQHQELLLTDIKHILWTNPTRPAYRPRVSSMLRPALQLEREPPTMRVMSHPAETATIGAKVGGSTLDFSFDNERPAHRVTIEAFGIHSLPVSCGEYLEFIEAGGYSNPAYWFSDGWDESRRLGWDAPLYWEQQGNRWWLYTLAGMKSLDEHEPVCHVSYYEADAFARWRGLRLPTEAEWEVAAGAGIPPDANLADARVFHPEPPRETNPSFFGNVWEWTSSAYSPYPGFRPLAGDLGEYNGKFMCNQMVLRGGSCATFRSHLRPTYRNFFAPHARWQFSGMRLAA